MDETVLPLIVQLVSVGLEEEPQYIPPPLAGSAPVEAEFPLMMQLVSDGLEP